MYQLSIINEGTLNSEVPIASYLETSVNFGASEKLILKNSQVTFRFRLQYLEGQTRNFS